MTILVVTLLVDSSLAPAHRSDSGPLNSRFQGMCWSGWRTNVAGLQSILHDSLGQTLMVIKNHAIFGNPTAAGRTRLTKPFGCEISGTTSQAIEEVRRITAWFTSVPIRPLGPDTSYSCIGQPSLRVTAQSCLPAE